jgi:hypothetical protein
MEADEFHDSLFVPWIPRKSIRVIQSKSEDLRSRGVIAENPNVRKGNKIG